MREIKFRGKRSDNGEWVYGSLYDSWSDNGTRSPYDKYATIVRFEGSPNIKGPVYHKVDPQTVGQYTGLKDANGVEIYEGDICTHDSIPDAKDGLPVVWDACYYKLQGKSHIDDIHLTAYSGLSMKVLGNIHDNPEFVE